MSEEVIVKKCGRGGGRGGGAGRSERVAEDVDPYGGGNRFIRGGRGDNAGRSGRATKGRPYGLVRTISHKPASDLVRGQLAGASL